jgi:beta-galactosidase
MKSNPRNILFILLILGSISCMQSGILESERTISFDTGWRFIKDDPKGAENASYDDSGWRSIDLPHDWSIEDLTDQSDSVIGPFSRASIGKMRTGYTIGGTGWYRKTFTIDRADGENTAYLNFDGVFMNSEMWINGKYVGRHSYGYTSFYFDITPYLNPAGQNNLVAVRIRNEGETARWYSGSGIYRHTWLTLVKPSAWPLSAHWENSQERFRYRQLPKD